MSKPIDFSDYDILVKPPYSYSLVHRGRLRFSSEIPIALRERITQDYRDDDEGEIEWVDDRTFEADFILIPASDLTDTPYDINTFYEIIVFLDQYVLPSYIHNVDLRGSSDLDPWVFDELNQ